MSPLENIIISEEERKTRFAIAESWIKDLEFLRDKFTGKMHRDLDATVMYVQDLAGFCIPIANDGHWGLRRWDAKYKNRRSFYLTPLLKSDADLHSAFAYFIAMPRYNEDLKAVFLPPDPMTREWRAIVLDHELCHTLAHYNRWFRRQKLARWAEEHSVYTREAHLASKVYGQPYLKKVNSLSKKFERMWHKKDLNFKHEEVASDDELDKIFGPALSRMERGLQRTLITLDALYRMINRLFKPGRLRDKHHQRLTFWLCDYQGYKKYREAEKQRKAEKIKPE
jgi:hypothetical protein